MSCCKKEKKQKKEKRKEKKVRGEVWRWRF